MWGPLEPPSHTPYTGWLLGSGIILNLGWWQRTLSLTLGLGFWLSQHAGLPQNPCLLMRSPGDTTCLRLP